MISGRIDTHHHVVLPTYAAWLKRKGMEAGGLPIPEWSADSAIALMDQYRIQTAIMSVSTPGVNYATDWPYAPEAVVGAFTDMYRGYSMNDPQRASIDRGNAEALFPRLQSKERKP